MADAATTATPVVDLYGAGQVGGALLRLLEAEGVPVAAIHRRSGVERRAGEGPTVLVDATPPRLEGPEAEAWVAFLERTLRSGTPVVTCNKAPLALAWGRLSAAARDGGVALAATATVGGGTPVLGPLHRFRDREGIASVEATLSGTLGVVLPHVKAGATLAEAVAEAQAAGLCEPDARLDLDGTDAWAKACILHNALWPRAEPVHIGDRPAPLTLAEHAIRALRNPAVVTRLFPGRVQLGLEDWAPSASRPGLLVRARSSAGSVLEISGAGAGPTATADVLLADVRAVAAGRLAPGIGP